MSRVIVSDLFMDYDRTPVLERVNIDVASGTFCAIVGASGCGKSTFLRLLLSQEQPTRGAIKVDGEDVALEPTPDRGIVFQRYSVFPHLTVTDNLVIANEFATSRFLGRLFGPARRRPRCRRRDAAQHRPVASARPLPSAALRWHATASRNRAGAGQEAESAAPRRAVRRARSRDPRRHARNPA
jgi:ABC-type sugar transport system ATPase subunit